MTNEKNYDSLENIKQYTNKLQRLIEYSIKYRNNSFNFYKKSYQTFQLDLNDEELIKSFDYDLKFTTNEIMKILPIINSEENGKLTEFDSNHNSLEEVFGELYNSKKNKVNIGGIKFKIKDIKSGFIKKQDILEKLVKKTFNISYEKYKEVFKQLDSIKNSEGIEKLSFYDLEQRKNSIVSTIKNELSSYEKSLNKLSIKERLIIDKEITFTRTMIDGVIQDSTFVSKQKGIEQVSSKHKKDIDELSNYIGKSKYFNSIELDKNTDIHKVINTMKQVDKLNLNLDKEMLLKVRLLGNYGVDGMCYSNLNLVAVDLKKPSALIHEITHMIDFNTKEKIENRDYLVSKYRSKMTLNPSSSKSEIEYYENDKEIIARLGELAYLFELQDNNIENVDSNDIKIVESLSNYEDRSGIYFNFIDFTKEDREEIKQYFHSLFRINQDFELSSMESVYHKKNTNYESHVLDKNKEENTETEKIIDYNKIFKRFNKDNIENILQYNEDNKILSSYEVIDMLLGNINKLGSFPNRMNNRMYIEHSIDKMEMLDKIVEYGFVNQKFKQVQSILEKNKNYINDYVYGKKHRRKSYEIFEEVSKHNLYNKIMTYETVSKSSIQTNMLINKSYLKDFVKSDDYYVLKTASYFSDNSLKEELSKNPNITEDIQKTLSKSSSKSVLESLLSNENLSDNVKTLILNKIEKISEQELQNEEKLDKKEKILETEEMDLVEIDFAKLILSSMETKINDFISRNQVKYFSGSSNFEEFTEIEDKLSEWKEQQTSLEDLESIENDLNTFLEGKGKEIDEEREYEEEQEELEEDYSMSM